MVDNGKIIIESRIIAFDSFMEKLRENAIVKRKVNLTNFKQYDAFVYKRDDFKDLDKEDLAYEHCLELTIKFFHGKTTIDITNSLRKWYFGKKSMRNFNLTSYKKCLKLIAKKLSIEYEVLLNAKITILEVGINLKLSSDFSPFLMTIMHHKRLGERCILNKGTVGFDGEFLKLIFYDKLKELYDKTDMLLKTYKKVSEKYFFLRIEVGFKSVSGVAFAKNNTRTVKDLIENWESVYDYIVSEIKNVTFFDWISPKVVEKIKFNKASEFYDWMLFSTIDEKGIGNLVSIVNKYLNRPSIHRNILKELSDRFRDLKKPSFDSVIFEQIYDAKRYIIS